MPTSKQRIEALELKLKQAASYTDSSDFECPLCVIDEKGVPLELCSMHKHIGDLEKCYRDLLDSFRNNRN